MKDYSDKTAKEARKSNAAVCGTKLRFNSYNEAKQRHKRIINGRYIMRTSKKRDNLHPYKCFACNHWHLGHESAEQRESRKKPYDRNKRQPRWEDDE